MHVYTPHLCINNWYSHTLRRVVEVTLYDFWGWRVIPTNSFGVVRDYFGSNFVAEIFIQNLCSRLFTFTFKIPSKIANLCF